MKKEWIFVWACKALTLLAVSFLFFIFLFIAKESFMFFQKTPLLHFLTGSRWNPIADPPAFGLQPMIFATVYVSLLATAIALPIGVGMAVILSVLAPPKIQWLLLPLIDLMAGIPSVVYGFAGLMIIVKFFETHFSWSSGESVLTGGILLAIMILPYVVSSKWHMMRYLVIPTAKKAIFAALILSLSRAMGETMAVMMVIGNSPIFPHLFRKAETIPALIALEMGGAAVGSLHYQALFAAGLILMLVLFAFNSFFFFIRKHIDEGIKW